MKSASSSIFPNDSAEPHPGPVPATASGRQSPDRRETIMSLVELLLKQNEGIGHGNQQLPDFEDDKDVPSVDEHIQAAGAESFHNLQQKINNLDKELRNFANAARQLGSSVAILSSAYHLRERLAQLLFLYHENAADLFPRKISHIPRDAENESPTSTRRRIWGLRRVKGKAQLHIPRPTVTGHLDPESFPEQLECLAKEVTTFLRCLNEFPEFTDEAVNTSILSFEGDLKYWASCLKEYATQFRYAAVQRYIHDLSLEMGEHIEELTSSLSMFIEVGVPTIRFAQKHGADNLLNLSTVATFFSAVTATTLQFSYELPRSITADTVNSFWFASLVFSIGASVNSLLGLTWKQAMYRSPGHRVPWWVLIWIKRSPLVFLVLSVACFSIGLCCFSYASQQAYVTSTITTVLTAFTSFGLAAVSAWFASERWAFSRHRGQKWLSDVLNETTENFLRLPGIHCMQKCYVYSGRHLGESRRVAAHTITRLVACLICWKRDSSDVSEDNDVEAYNLPTTAQPNFEHNMKIGSPTRRRMSDMTVAVSEASIPVSTTMVSPIPFGINVDKETLENEATSPSTTTVGKQLWKNAIRNMKLRNLIHPSPPLSPSDVTMFSQGRPEPIRKRTNSSCNYTSIGPLGGMRKGSEPVMYTQSRVATLVPKLNELEVTHDLAAHSALVKHMQFSPDGKYLATSSWDKTAVIFRVGNPFVSHRTLGHSQGFVGQVAWSPRGKHLLTKMPRGIKVWTPEDGVCKKTINRNVPVERISWFPCGEAFLSVEEESMVTKLDIDGKVLDRYNFGNIKVHDVAVTPDSTRLIVVGPLLRSPTGLQPSKSRVEKRIVVYNMDTKQVENQTPVLNDVKDITLAQAGRSGLVALVSYEHKAPPQLWKVELMRDRETNVITTARISLRHTYMPKNPTDLVGHSYFGGRNNEMVLCAGKAGDIHIWDQGSGALLHFIRVRPHGGDLTCIAWNHAAEDPFMFATGSHDGAVRVWTRHPDNTHDSEPLHLGGPLEFPRTRSPDEMGSNMSESSVALDDSQSGRTPSTFPDERLLTFTNPGMISIDEP